MDRIVMMISRNSSVDHLCSITFMVALNEFLWDLFDFISF
jgi:hypothetical protein